MKKGEERRGEMIEICAETEGGGDRVNWQRKGRGLLVNSRLEKGGTKGRRVEVALTQRGGETDRKKKKGWARKEKGFLATPGGGRMAMVRILPCAQLGKKKGMNKVEEKRLEI